ncbi:DUF1116 domain-containing protein [Spiractinospora alimapuensis]|uniref:DUF1116 domain-containing protein n=1 Tax=Spiractinospora alimapuensis TaxID=2820884 RepID=UPI001F4373DD|nr:DUF1116 domain-containing protein [Spiractinospora alimapuensis]QVQ53701.1 DUF1116 domain-containing protein [Spiractinospora alimapuensis]
MPSTESRLTSEAPSVVTVGAELLTDTLTAQGAPVHPVDFRPPLAGDGVDDALVDVLADPRRAEANETALNRVLGVRPRLVDVRPASEFLGLRPGTFYHAGPPIAWKDASGPLRGALIGAMLFEGLAQSPEEAEKALAEGAATLEPCHHHGGVGPMAGVVSPSMWVFVLRDEADPERYSWCSLNEGLGKVLRYGAYGPEVVERLRWMSSVLGPVLRDAVRARGPIDLGTILAQMLHMGDEAHNRNRAGTLMLLRDLLPNLVAGDHPAEDLAEVMRFVGGNDHFFLNLAMPALKLMLDAGRDVPGSSLVVAMARNGTEFGIQVSGTGDQWFTGPAQYPEGLFLGSYGPDDANPDIGDSAITETGGMGGFVMAAAPAIVRLVGGDAAFAMDATQNMYEITNDDHPLFQLPILDFRGSPTGIDVAKVVSTGILPQINTGMAGRVPGTGQVGAGLVTPPAECFTKAIRALGEAAEAP